ncbi:solute carrier organic anion transporter family member 74D-like isoform X1 [Argiope bruennichi]|uniref:solute carrier organic anion transporter family member 74D-like isoform X1 n=1 Tax=Argiope bruennichi TaxID=94029 RepID=UPI002493F864|nr:solute carrier organic anion transporter family member 74D-like isoform X1 [Argiope bruennichi]
MNSGFRAVPTSFRIHPLTVVSKDYLCGFGRWTPRWLQKYADPKFYLIVFGALAILQGAYFTYFIGIISTLEKRFAFRSKVTAYIMIAENVTPIIACMLLGYFGGKVHKPRLLSFCMFLVAAGCFLSGLPYFIYGPGLHIISKDTVTLPENSKREFCAYGGKSEPCNLNENVKTHPAAIIMFLANFLNGFGYIAFYIVGTPYLDDNVRKKNSPLYFSAMAALRIFGPTIGFLLSSFCLKYYEDPFYDPGIDPHNPRWVGAWWMGFFILGAAIFVFTILLALFPKELPERFRSEKKELKDEGEKDEMPKLKDFPQAIKRLMKNPILVCHVISITFQVNGFAGYFVFMPKFMESQYQQSASEASLFSGATGILSMLLGVLLGGFLIKKFKPRPRYLTGYMVLVEIFSVFGLFVSIFLGCDRILMPGTSVNEDQTLNLYNECNAGCGCTRRVFEPVCGPDGVSSFFSPCFAGCPNTTGMISSIIQPTITSASNATIFTDCKCVTAGNSTYEVSNVISGFCSTGCTMFMAYIIMLCVSKFVSSTARVGNTLITFRCVDAKDKSFALGVFGSVLAMFAFIPYPLIYGALTDSTCLVWEESCSKTGNCWLYDSDKFRYYLHGMSMLLISIGICFDIIVFFLSDRLTNFYGEDDEDKASEDRIARWIKDEEEEDIIFTKRSKEEPVVEMDPIM